MRRGDTKSMGRLSCSRVLIAIAWATLWLAACGGGGGGNSPPSNLMYHAPAAFFVNRPITPLEPTVTGSVTSYRVSPGLPVGLTLNASSGVISGTPTAAVAAAHYTVTASNSIGATATTLDLTVDDAPGFFASSSYSFTVGITATDLIPTDSGVANVSWSVAPALPAGLILNATNGSITGTPTAAAAPANYAVTATTSGAEFTSNLTLAVSPGPVLELGHVATIDVMKMTDVNLLSQDTAGHWVLWDSATATSIANGQSGVVDMAGPTVAMRTASGLETRTAATGGVLAEISVTPSWWRLASDGSYICAGTATALTVWSTAGVVLFSQPGDYSKAIAFAAPGQVQIALGAAGQNVVQTLSVPSGTSIVSPAFQGQFLAWFTDGGHFFSYLNYTLWVYSNAAVQQDTQTLPTAPTLDGVGGQGNWYWFWTASFQQYPNPSTVMGLFEVGGGAQSVASYTIPGFFPGVISGGTALGLFSLEQTSVTATVVTVVDLSGAQPASATYTIPDANIGDYAGTSSANWVVGDANGVILRYPPPAGPPQYFDYGAALSVAGSSTNYAIATASGDILYFNAATNALEGTIPFASSSVALSSNGAVLAAEANAGNGINVYSLPGGALINSFSYDYANSEPVLLSITLSESGTVLGETFNFTNSQQPCWSQTIPVAGGSPTWCDAQTPAQGALRGLIAISPDGMEVVEWSIAGIESPPATSIYNNGKLVTTVPGMAEAWLSDESFLVGDYLASAGLYNLSYESSDIYSSSGVVQQKSLLLPAMYLLQNVSPTTIYTPNYNSIYSLTTGAVTWTSASPTIYFPAPFVNFAGFEVTTGAVAGSQVVFPSGHYILAEPYMQP